MTFWKYSQLIQWVRKSHGWVGMWGAVLGLLFGFSGIWLNHRNVLKLPVEQVRSNAQLSLPDPVPSCPDDMKAWLLVALNFSGNNIPGKGDSIRGDSSRGDSSRLNSTKVNAARPVLWASKNSPLEAVLMQPEHWVFNFGGPNEIIQVEYWRGNRSVSVTTTSNGLLATFNNMHKGTGMSIGWILLVDTLAGSMIFLSLSGVLLWVQSHRKRAIGVALFLISSSLTIGLTLFRL